jgi:hypothetical protein
MGCPMICKAKTGMPVASDYRGWFTNRAIVVLPTSEYTLSPRLFNSWMGGEQRNLVMAAQLTSTAVSSTARGCFFRDSVWTEGAEVEAEGEGAVTRRP